MKKTSFYHLCFPLRAGERKDGGVPRVFGGCNAVTEIMKDEAKGAVSSLNPRPMAAAAAAKEKGPSHSRCILRVVPLSPTMHNILGVPGVSYTKAIKKVWGYIYLNNSRNKQITRKFTKMNI